MSPVTVPRMVLDFDGVICDPADECRLVTWLAAHPPDPSLPVSSYLVAVDRGFSARFMRIRGYARLLEHFMVAHYPGAEAISSRAEFAALFGSIPGDEIAAFAEAADAVRHRFRAEERWPRGAPPEGAARWYGTRHAGPCSTRRRSFQKQSIRSQAIRPDSGCSHIKAHPDR